MEILQLIYKAHLKLTTLESSPRDYGTEVLLYASEMHTLIAVGRNPGINLTELAEELMISKSAVSKFVRKLIDKDHLEKGKRGENRKEVSFRLTPSGEQAVEGHRKFEEKVFGPLYKRENNLSAEDRSLITGFLKDLHTLF